VLLTCNRNDFLHLQRRDLITASSLSSVVEPEHTNGPRYFSCSNVLAKLVFEIT
jgi:hypothetical protein